MQQSVYGGTAVYEISARRVSSRTAALHLVTLAALSGVAYAPFQTLPFISDDYTQIWLSRYYGPPSGWSDLARDVLYRCRATSLALTHGVEAVFGLWAPAYFLANLAGHILNSWLVLALGIWKSIGFRLSVPAAYVFALRDGHQEAVVWHAAQPEILVFAFVLLTVLAWISWLQSWGRSHLLYTASIAAFTLALLSKESAVAAVALLVLIAWAERFPARRLALAIAPFAVLSALYAAAIYFGRHGHLHLQDGTFSPSGPWWITLPNSYARMLWIWGLIAIAALVWLKTLRQRAVWIGMAWIAIALLPYSFLLYMQRVPSRHTYLAGAGISLVIAAAYVSLRDRESRARRWSLSAALALAFVLTNCAYLWWKKLPQYEGRAAVSERFLDYVRSNPGPIRVRCYPGSVWTAKHAANMVLGRPLHDVIDATLDRGPVRPDEYCDLSTH